MAILTIFTAKAGRHLFDGKLYTRAKDRRMKFILDAWVAAPYQRTFAMSIIHIRPIFTSHGPPPARQIEAWAVVLPVANVSDVIVENGRCQGVQLTSGERFNADTTLIAAHRPVI